MSVLVKEYEDVKIIRDTYDTTYSLIDIKTENEICCYDNIRCFEGDLAAIYDSEKGYNFINKKGELLCDTYFEDASNFYEGCAEVCKVFYENDVYVNWINTKGEIILKDWLCVDKRDIEAKKIGDYLYIYSGKKYIKIVKV